MALYLLSKFNDNGTNNSLSYLASKQTNGQTHKCTGTVHTSAKARLTSVAIWRISVNECP